ncbi:MAG: glycosyltransferase [bacterium]|jgi:glycosyltransferase involved in cell wall biosynthesis
MKPVAIHQLVAGFATGDAISHEALALRDICREAGFTSEIYAPADRIAVDAANTCRTLEDYQPQADETIIFHFSITSPATAAFLSSPARKILIYHNITPPEFFVPFDTSVANQLTDARQELKTILGQADAVWADSSFNAAELKELGFSNTKVFPLLFRPDDESIAPDPTILAKFTVPMKNILFVGRIAPNKCIEELITAFAWFHKNIEPQSRLLIVGSDQSAPTYYAMLKMYAAELGLDTVFFERFASPAGLSAYYQVADIFATTSRHEGYCLPLVEAMVKGVPVVSRQTGGTPEAMGDAGVMFEDLRAEELAELFGLLCFDAAFRHTVMESQQKRIATLLTRPVKEEFLALLGH